MNVDEMNVDRSNDSKVKKNEFKLTSHIFYIESIVCNMSNRTYKKIYKRNTDTYNI